MGQPGPGEKPHQLDWRRFGVRPLGAGRRFSPQGRTHTAGNTELCKKVSFWQALGIGEDAWKKSRAHQSCAEFLSLEPKLLRASLSEVDWFRTLGELNLHMG